MNNAQARQILNTLMDGVDPVSREPIPLEHPLVQFPVTKALELAIHALEKVDLQRPVPNHYQAGARVELDEFKEMDSHEQQVFEVLHGRKVPLSLLAGLLRRTVSTVREGLVGMGLLNPAVTPPVSTCKEKSRSSSAFKRKKSVANWRKLRPNAGKAWSAQEQITLQKYAAQGLSEAAIGKILGRGKKSVGVQLFKLGIRRK